MFPIKLLLERKTELKLSNNINEFIFSLLLLINCEFFILIFVDFEL